MSRFDDCLTFCWRPENDGQAFHVTPGDRGGATAWGVTLATYSSWRAQHGHPTTTAADLAAATRTDLGELYRDRYWDTVAGDHLPVGVDLLAFDFGVTSGSGTSAKLLQEVVGGLRVDGNLGPVTQAAAARVDRVDLVRRLSARHAAYYESLQDFRLFGRGWMSRNAARLAAALAAVPDPAASPAPVLPAAAPVPPTTAVHQSWLTSLTGGLRHALG